MTITKSFPHGYWQVSDVVEGQRIISMTYIGYTRREAVEDFKLRLKNLA